MYLKKFANKVNLILITHGFGNQTQFIESLLDGHPDIIQFPTNYKNYFLNLKSINFLEAIDEFINLDPGYVYDIFNSHKNKFVILNKSRIVPMIHDRDFFYFDNKSLNLIKKNFLLRKYYSFLKKNIKKKYKKKFIFKELISKNFKTSCDVDKLLEYAIPVYKIDPKKFKKIYLREIKKKNF